MQKIIKQSHIFGSHIATSAAFAGVLAALFLFAGISVANADSTYVVDTTGATGSCGSVCQQLKAYLEGNTSNVNNGSNTSSGNGFSPTGSPYFSAYTGNNTGNTVNGNSGSNGSNSGSNGSNYTPPPYMVYNYFQNPNPSAATSNAYGSTPSYNSGYNPYGTTSGYNYSQAPMYVQYGQNGGTAPRAGTQTSGTGFIRTSGY